jgi:hypothetical protein
VDVVDWSKLASAMNVYGLTLLRFGFKRTRSSKSVPSAYCNKLRELFFIQVILDSQVEVWKIQELLVTVGGGRSGLPWQEARKARREGRKEGRPAGRDDSRMDGLSDRWTDRLSLLTVVESRNGVENDR